MKKIPENVINEYFDDEIDIKLFFSIIWQNKKTIISITTFFSILGVIVSLLLPNIYESKAILVPVKQSTSISKSLQNYSGLAGFAGISLPSVGEENNSATAIVKIGSLSFFKNNFLPNIFLPNLMALKSWNSETNSIFYDDNIYDYSSNLWVRDYTYPQKKIPSPQEAYKVFIENHYNLTEDKKTGFVTLSIKHYSPNIAKKWIEILVYEINNFYRQKDQLESIKAINYLNEQITLNSLSEVKEVIAALLQEEMQKLALIEAKESYVFEYIDPPAAMEKKSEPKRAIICIFSAFLGVILSILIVLIRHYVLNKKIK